MAWDIGSTLLPGVPGSYVSKGTKAISKVTSKFDNAVSALKSGKVASKFDDAVSALKSGKDTLSITDGNKFFDEIGNLKNILKTTNKSDNISKLTSKALNSLGDAKNLDRAKDTAKALTKNSSVDSGFKAIKNMDADDYQELIVRNSDEVVDTTDVLNVISDADRAKINNWIYTPDDQLYLEHKAVFDNPKYYNQRTGQTNWPKNDGFANSPSDKVLNPGERIDRYGDEFGVFVSPEGTPYAMRSVAPGTDLKPYSVFEVIEPISVKSGKVSPWFDELGGGTQYVLPSPVDDLLESGFLRRIK